jgi:hypothetical protein
MMIQLEMGPDFPQTVNELGGMDQTIVGACSEGLKKGVEYTASYISENYLHGQYLEKRSGFLAKAVQSWMVGPLEGVVGVRPNSAVEKYKWLLGDEEKTITPKRAKFLTIPIGENLTGAGVARFLSPRQVPDGFFIKTKTGRLLFGIKHGKRGKFRPLFVLVKSVFVQGTGALQDGVDESLDNIVADIEAEIGKKAGS